MRLYEATKRLGNTTYIGMILVNNQNNMVMRKVMSTNRPKNAYLSGIERAVSYLHSNKIDMEGNIVVYGLKLNDDQPVTSEYIERMNVTGTVILNDKDLTSLDNRYIMLAKQEINRETKAYEERSLEENIGRK